MTYEERKATYQRVKDLAYYLVIGVVSLVATAFLPMIGTSADIKANWPRTPTGWAIWIVSRLSISAVNVLLFYCFMEQAKVNVRDDPSYKEANEILDRCTKRKELAPRDPKRFVRNQWLTKGTFLLLSSILSCYVFADAILRFDLAEFLTYLFVVCMGIAFGYLTMRKNEDYWTTEYLAFARQYEREHNPQGESNEL